MQKAVILLFAFTQFCCMEQSSNFGTPIVVNKNENLNVQYSEWKIFYKKEKRNVTQTYERFIYHNIVEVIVVLQNKSKSNINKIHLQLQIYYDGKEEPFVLEHDLKSFVPGSYVRGWLNDRNRAIALLPNEERELAIGFGVNPPGYDHDRFIKVDKIVIEPIILDDK